MSSQALSQAARNQRGRLKRRLLAIELTVALQRSLRLLLRAAWLGLGGYLLARSLSTWLDQLSDPELWKWVGLAFAFLPLAAILFSWPRRSKLVWSLDRRLKLHEQVSTAWQVARHRPRADRSPAPGARQPADAQHAADAELAVKQEPPADAEGGADIGTLLIADAAALLPRAELRILGRGWFLARDLVSLLIVIILWASMVFASTTVSYVPQDSLAAMRLPAAGEEPRAASIFPTGMSKLAPEAEEQPAGGQEGRQGGQGGEQQGQQAAPNLTEEQMQALLEAMNKLGEQLSQQAVTYDLGQALQNSDLQQAASEVEDLGSQASQLSYDTRKQVADAMRDGADQIEQNLPPETSTLPEDIRLATEYLAPKEASSEGNPSPLATPSPAEQETQGKTPEETARNRFDRLADDLRDLAEALSQGAGGASASGENSNQHLAEPAARLQGGNDAFQLQVTAAPSGLLAPGAPGGSPGGVAFGSANAPQGSSQQVVQGTVIPTFFPWNWLYAIAAYFQR